MKFKGHGLIGPRLGHGGSESAPVGLSQELDPPDELRRVAVALEGLQEGCSWGLVKGFCSFAAMSSHVRRLKFLTACAVGRLRDFSEKI